MLKHGHGGARDWILVAFTTVVGLTAYLFIPQEKVPADAAAIGIIALLVLKHLGLLAALGAPIATLVRTRLLPLLRRRAGAR